MWVLLQRVLLNSAVPHSPPQIDQYQGSEVHQKNEHKGERALRVSQTILCTASLTVFISILPISPIYHGYFLMCLPSSSKFSPLRFVGIHCHIHLIFTQKQIKRCVQKNANLESLACHLSKMKPSQRIPFDPLVFPIIPILNSLL